MLITVVFTYSKYISAPSPEKYPNIVFDGDRKDSGNTDKKYPATDSNTTVPNTATIKIAGKTIQVDLALTPAERAKGLSGRESLPDARGMLFIFEASGIYSFWMADMLFPIDIIWINEQKKIVHIEANVLPESFPKTFASIESAKYVLEVSAGFSDKTKLSAGDTITFLNDL